MRKTESAGGVVVNKYNEVLVVSQRGDSWSLPKGHIEEGEDALPAAKREIAEEGGVKNLTFVKQLPSYKRFRIAKGVCVISCGQVAIQRKLLYLSRTFCESVVKKQGMRVAKVEKGG